MAKTSYVNACLFMVLKEKNMLKMRRKQLCRHEIFSYFKIDTFMNSVTDG